MHLFLYILFQHFDSFYDNIVSSPHVNVVEHKYVIMIAKSVTLSLVYVITLKCVFTNAVYFLL